MTRIKNNISKLENAIDEPTYPQDLNLIKYLKETSETFTTFDKIYSFYYTNSQFLDHIEEMNSAMHAGDCASSCIIGCGSDLGCCGNYSGCCYFSHSLCLIHDIACEQCSKFHCGPGCVPDKVPNRVVSVILDLRPFQ